MNGELRRVQRDRDRETVAYYAHHAGDELQISRPDAEMVTAMLLGAISPALMLWHARPSEDYAAELEDAYMCLVAGTLQQLARRAGIRRSRRSIRTRAARPA